MKQFNRRDAMKLAGGATAAVMTSTNAQALTSEKNGSGVPWT